jgi:hypothetical protein
LWGSICAFGFLLFSAIMCRVLNGNWNTFSDRFPLPTFFPKNTWGYSLMAVLWTELIFFIILLIYKYILLKYIPRPANVHITSHKVSHRK